MESIGFKEWALVCEALGEGKQTILLRKGGLTEGRDGFRFSHGEFFLFPTFFHEQMGKIRAVDAVIPERKEGQIEIRFFARMEAARIVTALDRADALEPFHILQRGVVRERFNYDEAPGVHVAFVRIFRLQPTWQLPDSKSYGGCRSWVRLPAPSSKIRYEAVVSDAAHARRRRQFDEIIGAAA
ncbi:MAG: DUF1802 family protein [Verrucomicrobiota bacterium]